MGTNFYWRPDDADDDTVDGVHIGKSSAGWCFSLHVIPGKIDDLRAWRELWATQPGTIVNEYGIELDVDEMMETITNRAWPPNRQTSDPQWLAANHAEPGPCNLARHRIIDGYCIGHGNGTWDYLVGEFS